MESFIYKISCPFVGCLNSDDWMYFVHSYAPSVKHSKNIAATTNINGLDVSQEMVSLAEKKSIYKNLKVFENCIPL